MAQIAVSPLVLKDVTLTVGTDSYEMHVSGVTFSPATSQIEWRGLSPSAVFTDPGNVTWSCTLEYAQDWETPNSLSQYLHDNAGSSVEMTFKPKAASGPTVEATVTIVPGPIGGQGGAYATGSVTLGVQGAPEIVPAA